MKPFYRDGLSFIEHLPLPKNFCHNETGKIKYLLLFTNKAEKERFSEEIEQAINLPRYNRLKQEDVILSYKYINPLTKKYDTNELLEETGAADMIFLFHGDDMTLPMTITPKLNLSKICKKEESSQLVFVGNSFEHYLNQQGFGYNNQEDAEPAQETATSFRRMP